MASYNELNALIDAYINRNGIQAITGQVLNGVLKAMVDQLGRGYTIMGAALPTTDPGTPDGPESWFASTPGTYTNFGGLVVADAELALLSYTPSTGWAKSTLTQGIVQVDATIDANVGTPSVTTSYVDGVLTFDFSNMKGNTGDPAGFGSVSASVDANIGTPSVSVQTSGPDTAKNMAFVFRNLKGETGVTSVVATVDNTIGNPSCAVSLNGQELHLDFHGLKGAQGDTGSSVDYPFTIVNNLTTNDPAQALSAAMGVQLEGEIGQLEAKVDLLDLLVDKDELSIQMQTGGFWNGTTFTSNGGSQYCDRTDISAYHSKAVLIAMQAVDITSSGRCMVITDSSDNIIDQRREDNPLFVENGVAYYFLNGNSEEVKYLRVSGRTSNTFVKFYSFPNGASEIYTQLQTLSGQLDDNIVTVSQNTVTGERYTKITVGNDNYEITPAPDCVYKTLAEGGNNDNITKFQLVPGCKYNFYLSDTIWDWQSVSENYVIFAIGHYESGTNVIDYRKANTSDVVVDSIIEITANEADYYYINFRGDVGESINVTISNLQILDSCNEEIAAIKREIADVVSLDMGAAKSGYYDTYLNLQNGSGIYYDPVELDKYNEIVVKLKVTDTSSNTRSLGLKDKDGNILTVVRGDAPTTIEGDIYTYVFDASNAKYLYVSFRTSSELVSVKAAKLKAKTLMFVSPNGNDLNDGSESSPKLTINNALKEGANEICCFGGRYSQQIDLSFLQGGTLKMKAKAGDYVLFSESALFEGGETLVSGTTKVYSHSLSSAPYDSGVDIQWLFQDGVSDVTTLISDAERHPLQRGYTYRCDCTRIKKCVASVLSDAITEIENSSEYLWFYDSGTLYFSRPQSTTSNGIYRSLGNGLFVNGNRGVSLDIVGVNTRYISFNIENLCQVRAFDCSAKYVFGNCFSWSDSIGVELNKCEAAMSFYNSGNGDGFNAHSTYASNPFSKHSSALLIDCWAHDCNDDGYSDHGRCECSLNGGLFEYNGKAGVTPATGSHCCAYNVKSRKNKSGFRLTGAAQNDEGGKYSQLICYNCVAENNTDSSTGFGFYVDGAGNKMELIDCKSIGNLYGYSVYTDTIMDLYDCKAKDNSISDLKNWYDGGTMNVINSNLLPS